MGWSFGSVTAMAMFSDPALLPDSIYHNLKKYIRSLVLYSTKTSDFIPAYPKLSQLNHRPPYLACGYELPKECKVYNPYPSHAKGQSAEDSFQAFRSWVSSYYTVPDDWSGNINNLDHRSHTEKTTLDQWMEEEHRLYFTMEVATRSEWDMYLEPMQTTLRDMTRRVLFNNSIGEWSFPTVSVVFLCPCSTNCQCFWGCWVTKRLHKEHTGRGEDTRPLFAIQLEGRNYFAHYDFPDELIDKDY